MSAIAGMEPSLVDVPRWNVLSWNAPRWNVLRQKPVPTTTQEEASP